MMGLSRETEALARALFCVSVWRIFLNNESRSPAVTYARVLQLFSAPQPFGGVLRAAQSMQLDERRLVPHVARGAAAAVGGPQR